jgi:hypothetical protein
MAVLTSLRVEPDLFSFQISDQGFGPIDRNLIVNGSLQPPVAFDFFVDGSTLFTHGTRLTANGRNRSRLQSMTATRLICFK